MFEPTSPFQKFEKLTDTTARGLGVIDMKGDDVIMLQAFKALRASGVLDRMSITAVFSGDEESAGRPLELARADLVAAAKPSQYAIGGTDVRTDSTQPGGSAYGKSNVVSKEMRVSGDIRALSPEQLAATERTMRAIAAESLPHTTSEITFDDGYPPLAPTDGNRGLLAIYDKVSRDLGYWPVVAVDPMRAGAADVSFAAPYINSAMDAVGLAGWDDHTDKETADLRMFGPLTKRGGVPLSAEHRRAAPGWIRSPRRQI